MCKVTIYKNNINTASETNRAVNKDHPFNQAKLHLRECTVYCPSVDCTCPSYTQRLDDTH